MHVQLDAPLPAEVAVGAGTALFVAGWCHMPGALELEVDGARQPLAAQAMPRIEVLRAVGEPDAYRSGFWGLAELASRGGERADEAAPRAPGGVDERVIALVGGGEQAELARVRVVERERAGPRPEPAPGSGPFVAICMATYEPPPDLLTRQLASLRTQAHRNWVCVISDDCSSPERFAALEAAVAGDSRFVLSRSARRLGFYANFERALSLAPANAAYVAMADQDDAWYPDKLATLLDAIGSAQLVYSDARIVDRAGAVLAESFWEQRRNEHDDLTSLLVANAVTGAASLLRRDVLDRALPFPPGQFTHFHDHWVALTALALGDVAFVDRPLYDYVQHGAASQGHAASTRTTGLRDRVAGWVRDPRERVPFWRLRYFADAWRLMQFATVLRMRCSEQMTPAKRRALDRFLAADRSWLALGHLWARGARELAASRPTTLAAEWGLANAFAWRRAVSATARLPPDHRVRMDAMPPPSLAPKPGRTGPEGSPRVIAEQIAPLDLAVADDAPARINVLLPDVDLDHLFAGYIGKLNLARRLAERGARVRLVTFDPARPLPPSWRAQVESYAGLAGLFDRVELAFGRQAPLEVSREDRFVATTWRSAHLAAHAGGRFLYLIQEHEPFTFPNGTYAALAAETYTFPHVALFSTELLRDYFRRHRLGVYAHGDGDAVSAAFENAITDVAAPSAAELAARPRRLLFYARPEPHAERNMFELGVLAIDRALARGALAGWELHGIGADDRRRIGLGGGAALEVLPRTDQASYARVLRDHDVGVALMHTPHPSLVPIEMAAAGMLAVTTTFEHKTAEAMAAISPNLRAVAPTIAAVAEGIERAVADADDVDGRVAGSAVRWSRDWDASFGDQLMARVEAWLRA